MSGMPASKALLGYDVIGSSRTDDDLLEVLRERAAGFVGDALRQANIDPEARTNYSHAGDGSLAAYPEATLPRLIDAAHHLNIALYRHNRRELPNIRIRLAIHVAPMTETHSDSFQRPYIELARALGCAELRNVVRATTSNPALTPVTVATILSDRAYQDAVGARRAAHLLPHHFGEVEVVSKEYRARCWIHVPGLDAARISELANFSEPDSAQPKPKRPESARQAGPTFHGRFQGNFTGGNSYGANTNNFGTDR